MKTRLRPSLLCFLLLVVFSDTSESIFFGGPRRAIWNLLETLGGHKHEKPIHHYHMHYYPVPLPLVLPKPVHPKIEIALTSPPLHISQGHVPSLNWPSDLPETGWLDNSWPDSAGLYSAQHKSWAVPDNHNNDILAASQRYEAELAGNIFKKLRRINDALLHPETEEHVEHHDDKPQVHNSLTYTSGNL